MTSKLTFGTSYCAVDNNLITGQLGLGTNTVNFLSCDEFPFASSEEGGGYFGNLATGATAVSTMCVPVWQQNIQGRCNSLLSGMQTNVAYFDDPTATPNWQPWSSGNTNWFRTGAGQWQRLALYPAQIPQATDISSAFYGPNTAGQYGGYFLKRNFTMGLAEPSQASQPWGAQTPASWASGGQSSSVITDIFCAINTFGQNDIYQLPTYNGYCFNGLWDNEVGYGIVPKFQPCTITFTGAVPPPNSKRDSMPSSEPGTDGPIIGTFNGWGVQSEPAQPPSPIMTTRLSVSSVLTRLLQRSCCPTTRTRQFRRQATARTLQA